MSSRQLVRRLGHIAARGALDGAAALLAFLLGLAGIRFLHPRLARIGEFGATFGFFVQLSLLSPGRPRRVVVWPVPASATPANRIYLRYWSRHRCFLWNRLPDRLAFRVANRPGMTYPLEEITLPNARRVLRDTALATSTKLWEDACRPPLLDLEPSDVAYGDAALMRLGMHPADWFVALHVREPGFLKEGPGNVNEHRNADIETYLPAVRQIVQRGGWVVRLGDATATPLPPLDHVVDYANSHLRDERLDVYLAARCRFFLGTSSGMFVVAWSFGRPCVLTNWNTLVTRPWSQRDIFLPKLWRTQKEGRLVTLKEALQPPYAVPQLWELSRADVLAQAGLEVVDNTAEEIDEAVEEFLAREAGRPYSPEEEELQQAFRRLVVDRYPLGGGARLASGFLRRHAALFAA